MGIEGVVPAVDEKGIEIGRGKLYFQSETVEHYQKILQDIDDFLNSYGQLQGDNYDDNYTSFLMRNNCILYGAPGTGKTEFVRELNRALIEKYGSQQEEITDPDDPRYGLENQNQEEKK